MSKKKIILVTLLLAIPIMVVGLVSFSLALLVLDFKLTLPYQLLISVLAIVYYWQQGCESCEEHDWCQDFGMAAVRCC